MRSLAIIVVAALIGLRGPGIAWSEEPSDWSALFDGQSLDGWIQRGGTARYEVREGMIVGTAVVEPQNSFLCTERDYTDFELRLEFWVDDGLNSGIQIRSHSLPEYQEGRVHGYQVEIDPSECAYSGGIYDEARAGWIHDLDDLPAARAAFRDGTWNKLRILARGTRVQTWINRVPAADVDSPTVERGFIALQVHAIDPPDRVLQVRWRNIQVRELPTVDR